MTQSGKLIAVTVVLSLLAIVSGLLFGRERLPLLKEDMDVWVSRQDQNILHRLSDQERELLGEILSRQKKQEDQDRYEDFVLAFAAYQDGREVLQPSLYRLTDGTNEFVMKYPDGACYGLDTRWVLQLLTSDTLDDLFEYIEDAPTMTVSQGSQSLTLHCVENGWQYKKIDNSIFMDGVLVKDDQTLLEPEDYQGLSLSFSTEPQSVLVQVSLPGYSDPVFQGGAGQLDQFDPPVSGRYEMRVTARWVETALRRYSGECVYALDLQVKKAAEILVPVQRTTQGGLLEITVLNPQDPASLTVRCDAGRTGPFVKRAEGVYSCLLAARYAGTYTLSVSGEQVQGQQQIQVDTARIETVGLPFPLQTPAEAPQLSLEETQERFFTGASGKYWRGIFRRPLKEDPVLYGHQAFEGQPSLLDRTVWWQVEGERTVAASNTGVVVFVGRLDQGGLSVAVHHGMGLYTWYYGLSEALVEEGAAVSAEDALGVVRQEEEAAWFGTQAVFYGVPLDLSRLWTEDLLEG
ncbi:MAG: M23 family metallopeptidase [Oscillospiraceae bacterium]|nr:M23 family metallopeptidase [Oscillospiraceae bacterium]